MIPKVIHYCWFGHNQKPDSFSKYLASWKKYCPDYEIIEWNEENFDITINDYVKEAYAAKKWAFVTDYARLWIIYNHGGIYLDTDVEVIKSFDELLCNDAFFGFEDEFIATGLGFGAVKWNTVVELMIKDYAGKHFLLSDGKYDTTTCPVRNTNSIKHLFPTNYDQMKSFKIQGAVLFPPEYFCPLNPGTGILQKTSNTYSIHHYTATWLSEDQQVVHQWRLFKRKCEKKFGKWLGGYIARAVYLFFPEKRKVLRRM